MLQTIVIGILAGFAVTQAANFATSVYLHRTLSHRAMTMNRGLSVAFRSVIWLSTGLRPREWVAVHRKHHAFTDEAEDPHSPARLGWLRVQLTNPGLYRRVARDESTVHRFARDLEPTRADRWLFDRAFVGLGLGIALLIVTLGWQAGLIAALAHVGLYLGLSGSVNKSKVSADGPGRANVMAPGPVGIAIPSAPMMRPAISRSRISWFVPARRFWFASASCAAESLILSAF